MALHGCDSWAMGKANIGILHAVQDHSKMEFEEFSMKYSEIFDGPISNSERRGLAIDELEIRAVSKFTVRKIKAGFKDLKRGA
jgi:hypothetical protein